MKVKELIEQLSKLDGDVRVFGDGYEGGYVDVDSTFEVHDIALKVHKEDWMGPHELARNKYYVPDTSKFKIVKGIIL